MPQDIHQLYDAYRRDPNHEMHEYAPILRANARGQILEIGVRGGVSTAAFLCGLEENDPNGHLYSVDIDPECGKLFEHPQWTFICADSKDYAGSCNLLFPSGHCDGFDVMLIDGDHSREGVRCDLAFYGTLLNRSGLLFMHDIGPFPEPTPEQVAQNWPTKAVREEYELFIENVNWTSIELPGKFGMGLAIRI